METSTNLIQGNVALAIFQGQCRMPRYIGDETRSVSRLIFHQPPLLGSLIHDPLSGAFTPPPCLLQGFSHTPVGLPGAPWQLRAVTWPGTEAWTAPYAASWRRWQQRLSACSRKQKANGYKLPWFVHVCDHLWQRNSLTKQTLSVVVLTICRLT